MATRKLALVTGANKGIGYAIAKQLLQTNQFNVLLGARNLERGASAFDKLKQDIPDLDSSRVDVLNIDVSDESSIKQSLDYVTQEKKFGQLDVLVNNAGIASGDEFYAGLVKNVFATNFYGAINCTQTYLPLLKESGNGRVLMMSSRVGAITKLNNNKEAKELLMSESLSVAQLYEMMAKFIADLDDMEAKGMADSDGNLSKEDVAARGWWNSAYGMSKLGLSAYTRILARESRDTGLFVSAYCPGFVATDMTASYGKNVPLGPDDGARGMLMLANPGSADAYMPGGFWCLNKKDDVDLSPVDWERCRIPRQRKLRPE